MQRSHVTMFIVTNVTLHSDHHVFAELSVAGTHASGMVFLKRSMYAVVRYTYKLCYSADVSP